MEPPARTLTTLAALALLAGACGGGGGVAVEPLGDAPSDDVLSACEPADDQETTVLVEADDQRPSVDAMEQAIASNPDAEFMIEDMASEGHSRADALFRMYGQVVGQGLFADAEGLPGFVTGAFARPLEGEPFRLSFSGTVPEELDPSAHDLEPFGLEVTTGAAGLDHDAMAAAIEAAGEVGIEVVSGSGDETTGTARIAVIDATRDQVAAWEQAVDDPSRWCMVRAPRSVTCDDGVIAAAAKRAEGQGEVLPNVQTDGPPTAERADRVRRSYLGLTLEEAEAKAAQEDREVRVTVRDGVALASEDDLRPGRLDLTVCEGIVVDTRMDLEPA